LRVILSLFNKFLKRELHGIAKPTAEEDPAESKTYYVNAFRCKVKSDGKDACIVGLFDSNYWSGMPGLSRSFSSEYYVGTKLLAYYKIKPHPYIVNFNNRCGEIKLCGRRYEKIPIVSRYKEKRLEAESLEEAIAKFSGFEFD